MNTFIPAYILSYSNSDFTNPHEVVLADDPKDCTNDYTHMGVKYWGLETNRHTATSVNLSEQKLNYKHDAHQWMRIAFKKRARLSSLQVSTKWFTGNQVRAISVILIDALNQDEKRVLTRADLKPDRDHEFQFTPTLATECLIKMYYEGGISRINFYGEISKEQLPEKVNQLIDSEISHVSNEHYGHPKMAVDGCREQMHMEGWESARTGFGEQAIFHLNNPRPIQQIVVDTYLHRLNPPLSCHVFGIPDDHSASLEESLKQLPKWGIQFSNGKKLVPDDFQSYMLNQKYLDEGIDISKQFEIFLHTEKDSPWKAVLPFAALHPDTYHRFETLEHKGPFSHMLYMHYPNGGIHGLKVF